jgi:hypothetical protein
MEEDAVYSADVNDKLDKMSQAQECLLKEIYNLSKKIELLSAKSAVPQRIEVDVGQNIQLCFLCGLAAVTLVTLWR